MKYFTTKLKENEQNITCGKSEIARISPFLFIALGFTKESTRSIYRLVLSKQIVLLAKIRKV